MESTRHESYNEVNQRLTNYGINFKFYFSIKEFVYMLDLNKFAYFTMTDLSHDYELKYLLNSRIKEYMNHYTRIFHVQKLTSLENKIQANVQKLFVKFNLEASKSESRYIEESVEINVEFYSVEELCNVRELPLTREGFQILKRKYINNLKIYRKNQAELNEDNKDNTNSGVIVNVCDCNKDITKNGGETEGGINGDSSESEINENIGNPARAWRQEFGIFYRNMLMKIGRDALEYHEKLLEIDEKYSNEFKNANSFGGVERLIRMVKRFAKTADLDCDGFDIMANKDNLSIFDYDLEDSKHIFIERMAAKGTDKK